MFWATGFFIWTDSFLLRLYLSSFNCSRYSKLILIQFILHISYNFNIELKFSFIYWKKFKGKKRILYLILQHLRIRVFLKPNQELKCIDSSLCYNGLQFSLLHLDNHGFIRKNKIKIWSTKMESFTTSINLQLLFFIDASYSWLTSEIHTFFSRSMKW